MKTFSDVIMDSGCTISGLAHWCCISRQTIYKYINGMVRPENLSYINITLMATYLDVEPDVVYNSIVAEFEKAHVFNEDTGKWE